MDPAVLRQSAGLLCTTRTSSNTGSVQPLFPRENRVVMPSLRPTGGDGQSPKASMATIAFSCLSSPPLTYSCMSTARPPE